MKKRTGRGKSAATEKANKTWNGPRHGWDEVAHNWNALHAGATPLGIPLDTLGLESVESSQKAESKPTARKVLLSPVLKNNGLSIRDWASKANVSFDTARDYLNGKSDPYPSTRKKLADALGIRVEDFPT